MALIKYNHKSMMKAIEPGLSSIIVNSFREKLEAKINGVVEEVFDEMVKEIPEVVKTSIASMMSPESSDVQVRVVVDLTEK